MMGWFRKQQKEEEERKLYTIVIPAGVTPERMTDFMRFFFTEQRKRAFPFIFYALTDGQFLTHPFKEFFEKDPEEDS